MSNITNITNITNIKHKLYNDKIFLLYYEYRYAILIGLIFGSISSIIASYVPLLYSNILKILLNENNNNNDNNINFYIVSYIIYKFASNLFAGLRGYIFTRYIHYMYIDLKNDILSEFFNKDLSYLNSKKPIYKIDLLTNNCKAVADLYSVSTNMFVRNTVNIITVTYILLNKSLYMYLMCIFLASIQYIVDECYSSNIYNINVENTNKNENKQKDMITDYINKIETYRSLGLENKLSSRLKFLDNELKYLKKKEANFYGLNFLVMNTFNSAIVCIMIYFGKYLNINYKNIYEFIVYTSEIVNIIRELVIVKKDFIKNKLSLIKIKEIYETSNENNKWGNFIHKNNKCFPSIEFKNIDFSYSEDNKILSNLNLYIRPFEIIGIKGQSGSGKSTLLKLLLGLIEQDKGEILVDNINIKDYDKEYFYNNMISYVGQEPHLIDGNIENNILIDTDYDVELYENVKMLVSDIKNNENTFLSGGQKQRVAICRAFMKKTKILLLDEPTSALDNINEEKVCTLIKKLSKLNNITIIIISHRDKTLNICNQVIDFDKIKIN